MRFPELAFNDDDRLLELATRDATVEADLRVPKNLVSGMGDERLKALFDKCWMATIDAWRRRGTYKLEAVTGWSAPCDDGTIRIKISVWQDDVELSKATSETTRIEQRIARRDAAQLRDRKKLEELQKALRSAQSANPE